MTFLCTAIIKVCMVSEYAEISPLVFCNNDVLLSMDAFKRTYHRQKGEAIAMI